MGHTSLPSHIQALLQADIYPHECKNIELIQTHISWVVLTGTYAYKLKKPCNFGFLDFTTLKKRQYFCERELEYNRRLAPELYLDVLPLRHHRDNFTLESNGEIVDYCVKMRQFEHHALLAEQIEHTDFDPACMDQLATDIAAFHKAYPYPKRPDDLGSAEMLLRHIQDNLEIGRMLADGNKQIVDTLKKLDHLNSQQIHNAAANIENRQISGFIRQCHGDLHLNNIAIMNGKAIAFDCIEFNDDYRIIDTMNDIAFLVMDCHARERDNLGLRFLSRYLESSNDYQGLCLLDLYASYRAGVRGKVASLLAQQTGLPPAEKTHKTKEAIRYFQLALDYTNRKQPQLFAVGGFSGSGKSYLALQGCAPEHAIVIRSDATRKRLATHHPTLPLYSKRITDLTYSAMFDAAQHVLNAGYSAILDATFLEQQHREQFRKLARRTNTPSHFIWLNISEDLLQQRLRNRCNKGNDISDASPDILKQQLSRYSTPTEENIMFVTTNDSWPICQP